MYKIAINQNNVLPFIMTNASGQEVTGLGGSLTVLVSKNGAAFQAGAGATSELGHGWYSYTATATECNTPGPLTLTINGAGCVQQNLVYPVETIVSNAVIYTYTVTDSLSSAPIEGVDVWFTTDADGQVIVATGRTDSSGEVVVYLEEGTYYVWRSKNGYSFTNPDTEVVSNA